MWFQQIILVMFTCSFVFGEDSFHHDFEDNFEDVFSHGTGVCSRFRPWIRGNYETTSVIPPNSESSQFVKPDTGFSCIFSKPFKMSHEGQLQLSVYLSFTTLLDEIKVIAYKSQNNVVVEEIMSSLQHFHTDSAWNILNITINDNENETFDGFVAIIGRASSDSDILVDHIQYLPPSTSDKSSEEKISEEKSSEEKSSEEKNSEEKSSEDKISEEKSSEEKISEEKSSEEKISEEKSSEEKISEEKSSEEKISEEKSSEEKISEEKSSEEKISEEKSSEEKISEEKSSEEKSSEEKNSEEKSSEEECDKCVDPSENCFIHNFDQGLSDVFSHGSGFCTGILSWIEENYNSTSIQPFHIYANSFVKPDTLLSCILSTKFEMSAGGKLQLNVYMNLTAVTDQIRIIVYEIRDSGNFNVGEHISSKLNENFNKTSWNTFEIKIGGNDSFDAQIAISGRAAAESSILVDSVRYLPPTSDSEEINDDDICPIYGPITYQCIEYVFDYSFDFIFDHDHDICTGGDTWIIVRTGSGYTIQPREIEKPCCISTPSFTIPSSGNLTVNVSIKSESYLDTILIAMEYNKGKVHTVGYNKLVKNDFKSNDLYELRLELEDIKEEYDAKIIFIGYATEEATVAVHSFRFQPSSWDGGNCKTLLEFK